MIRPWMGATVMLAVLTFGATVGLEAVGLLFQSGTPEPGSGNIQPRDHPEVMPPQAHQEPILAEKPGDTEEELRPHETDHQEAAGQAQDEERKTADAHRWAERYRRKTQQRLAALEQHRDVPEPKETEAAAEIDRKGPGSAVEQPMLVGAPVGPSRGDQADGRVDDLGK